MTTTIQGVKFDSEKLQFATYHYIGNNKREANIKAINGDIHLVTYDFTTKTYTLNEN